MGIFDELFKNKFSTAVPDDDYFTDNWSVELPEEKYNAIVKKHTDKFLTSYNLNDINSILSIPVPAQKETRIPTSVVYMPEQILSRKATEYKKSGDMDLAIACLRKANEFRPVSWFSYQSDDYMNLVEYLKLNRQFDEARKEESILKSMYPELFYVVRSSGLDKKLEKANNFGIDLLSFHVNNICPQCSPYKDRIYSISGNSSFFAPLSTAPSFLTMNRCSMCDCVISVSLIDNVFLSSHPDIIEINRSPIKDVRTQEQKTLFKQKQLETARAKIAKIEYDYLFEHFPEICPKNLASYSRMKNSNSANFQKIVAIVKERGFEIKII